MNVSRYECIHVWHASTANAWLNLETTMSLTGIVIIYVCMYVCMYAPVKWVYVCTYKEKKEWVCAWYIHVCVYVHTLSYIRSKRKQKMELLSVAHCIHTCVCVCVHVFVCMCVRARAHIDAYIHKHAYTHTHAHARTHTRKHWYFGTRM
jgi:hypothetical protein